VHTLLVHRHAVQLATGQRKGMPGRAVTRVFHSHAVARLQQQLCTKADGLLCTTGDHNLFSGAAQPTRATQVGRYQLTQQRLTCRVAITQLRGARVAPETRLQLGPDVEGEQIERRNTDAKSTRRTISRWWQV